MRPRRPERSEDAGPHPGSPQPGEQQSNEQQAKGIRRMYFTTEHGRMQSLRGELGPHRSFEAITTEEVNNKFFCGRAEF